jgi:hypothetical protein
VVLRVEDVRMTFDHLLRDAPSHVVDVEVTGLTRHLREQHHLKEQVPQLLLNGLGIARFNGVDDLVGLLDDVGPHGLEVLRLVPRTPVGPSEAPNDGDQLFEWCAHLPALTC